MKTILKTYLEQKFKGSEKEFFSEEEINEFLEYYSNDIWNNIGNDFINFFSEKKDLRQCSICGKLMDEGFIYDGGASYYCSDECLRHDFTKKEWKEEFDTNENSCWTTWW